MRENKREKEKTSTLSSIQQDRNELVIQSDNDSLTSATNLENRRAQSRALDEIATRILALLHIQANDMLVQTLTDSIRIKARSTNCTLESAAQRIAARAAFVATQSPPDDWVGWFSDARYEYVVRGDMRLRDRRGEARPICGGSRCAEGWETVQVNGTAVLRRCPDCVRLWSDLGL